MRPPVIPLRVALSFAVTAAVLSGCSESSPSGGSLVTPQTARLQPATSSSGDLLYLGENNTLETYTYPGDVFESKVATKFSIKEMCSDTKGDVFVAAVSGTGSKKTGAIYEYAHGGDTPIATLATPARQLPSSCSSDPATGDLAVGSYNRNDFAPQVNVYVNASGTPKVYTSEALAEFPQVAYDDAGDLFAVSSGNVGAELVAGAGKMAKITLSQTLGLVTHAQWDGEYFALQSFGENQRQRPRAFEHIYRVAISGSSGKIVSTVHFDNWIQKFAGQSWLQGGTLIATPGAYVAFWNYPQGGKVTKILHPKSPGKAVTVSVGG